ncbi:MAG: hypothetical protein EPN22_00065 [Nitrospirae bacterium]|nr:MAG: hypothetical protein EPN22_00065 [Nitrospirota bacterium]
MQLAFARYLLSHGRFRSGLFSALFLYILSCLLTFVFVDISFAEEQWAKTFGGSGKEEAYSIEQTSDGGYIAAGYTDSFGAGNEDFWVMKLDGSGNIQWQKTYGGIDSDWANSIKQTSDGGYIVAGVTYSFGAGSADMWVLKLADNGSVQWQKTYGGTDSDFANSVQQTSDGGYIVAGVTYSFGAGSADAWILKLTSNGSVEWEATFGGAGNDFANSVQQASDGGYIVAGDTDSFYGNRSVWVFKLNSVGGAEWEGIYEGTSFDFANSVQQTTDGGYIVAGYTWSSGAGNEDVWILKLNNSGYVQWQYTYGGAYNDWAYSARQTSDGGYIAVGVTYSFNAANGDIWVLKLNSNGAIQWQNSYGAAGGDGAYTIRQTSGGGYIIAGVTYSFGAIGGDFWILKLNSDGSIAFAPGSGASLNITDSGAASGRITTNIVATASALNGSGNIGSATTAAPQDSAATVGSQKDGTCSFTLSSASKSYSPAGGVDNVTVTASLDNCTWQATTGSSWMTVTSATNFTGSGTVSYSYAANTGPVRTGALILGGKALSISQDGCTYTLSPTSQSFQYSGGNGSIVISSSHSGCTWDVSNSSSWISLSSNTSGTGSGVAGYSVAANTASSIRTANLTIAGQTFSITQDAVCTYSLSSSGQSFTSTGGSGSVNVSVTPSGCTWSVSRDESWITLTSGTSGSGNGTVTFTVAARGDSGPNLSGKITIAGLTYTITQSGASTGQTNTVTGASGTGTSSTTVTDTGATTGSFSDIGTGTSGTATSGTGSTGQATASAGGDTPIVNTGFEATAAGYSQAETVSKSGVSVPGTGCSYTLSSASVSIATAGGAGSVTVSVSSDSCTWVASSDSPWITINTGSSGAGTGIVNFTVSANNGRERTGALTIAGQTIVVTQEELPCAYSINSQGQVFNSFKNSGSVVVTAFPEYCVWESFSSDPWLSVSFGDKGMGNGMVYYALSENSWSAARVGTLTIAGQTFSVVQDGVQCSFVLSKSSKSFGVSGGEGDVMAATADPKCLRDVVSNADWIKITSGASETGSGVIGFSVSPNTGAPRTSSFTVAGKHFTVTQGSDCAYALSPSSSYFSLSGGSGEIAVKTSMGACRWDVSTGVDWIKIISGGTETGSGKLEFSVAANSGPPRIGVITVAGQEFTVTQGSECGYAVSPTSQAFAFAGGTGTINIKTSGESCIRTAYSNSDWITVTSGSEEKGSGAVTFSVSANNGPPRSGTLSVADQLFTVTQGSECAYTISPASRSFSIAGGSGDISIKASKPDCRWEVVNTAGWIIVTSSPAGRGSGIVRFTATSNTGPPRNSKIEIGSAKFTVSQEGCGYTVFPATLNYPAGGGTASLNVKTTGEKCGREITVGADWINIGSGKNESGSGSILVNLSPNKGPARSEQITIGGQPVMIKQDSGCSFVLSTQSQSFGASGGKDSLFLKPSSEACIPQAVSGSDWIVIEPGVGEKAAGVVKYSVSGNTTGKKREGSITVSGKRFVVIQDK